MKSVKLPGMRVIAVLLFLIPLMAAAQAYFPPESPRRVLDLNPDWKFIRQDVASAQDPTLDDSLWTPLGLPHTWNNLDGQDGGSNYYRGVGWYRKHYAHPAQFAGRRCFLKFDGANLVAEVWINGVFVGRHEGGYAAFTFDVTDQLGAGLTNLIAVKVNNASNTNIPPLSADFTFFGGIYRDVHLLVTDPVHISPLDHGSPGVYLKTTNVSSNSAELQVTALVSNGSPSTASIMTRAVIVDAQSNVVATLTNSSSIPAATLSNTVVAGTIANPRLWNGRTDPYVYRAHLEVWNGTNLVDLVSQPLGFRYFRFDPTNGFLLNGKYLDLHGVNMHQDWLDKGWVLSDADRETNFALIKEMGCTTIRLAHYQHCDHTYQLGDQSGLVIWAEIPLVNRITESPEFYENSKQQLRELIRQNYNHPSIFCWGIFNEITLVSGPTPNNLVAQLALLAKQEDPTRPSTAASAAGDSHASNWSSDLVSFNKYFGWYGGSFSGFGPWADTIHANYPTRCVGVSEYGAGASPWHHSEDPVAQPTPGGPFHPEEWQNLFHESHWQQMKSRPFLWAKHVWNMFDFGVDSRNEGERPGRNDKGLVTYDRQVRKDAFYWYKANWTTDPMVYLTGHTFTNRKTTAVTAKIYSNCDSVQLWLNGSSQGTRTSTNRLFTWPLILPLTSNYVAVLGTLGTNTVADSLVWTALREPFRGKAFSVPGRFQAEDYDAGPSGVAYLDQTTTNSGGAFRTNEPVDIGICADTGGGYDVRDTAPAEWLGYTIKVASDGLYDLDLRVAAPSAGSSLRLFIDTRQVALVSLPLTGGPQTWQTVTVPGVALNQGEHLFKVLTDTGGFSLNWLNFTFKPSSGAYSARFNFQTISAAIPGGYLADTGLVYALRPSGYYFGWNLDNTANTRERNSTNSADKRYDTFNHMQRNGTNWSWQLALPNGRYTVRAVCGDPGFTDSYHSLLAESTTLVDGAPGNSYLWVEGAAEILVEDGKLSIVPSPAGSNSKISFLDVYETLGTYTAWRLQQFGTNAYDPAIAGDAIDLEDDGQPNWVEYAFNTNPKATNAPFRVETAIVTNSLQVTFDRRKPPTDVEYTLQEANDIRGPWSPVDMTNSVVLTDDGTMLRLRVDLPTTGTQRFITLAIRKL